MVEVEDAILSFRFLNYRTFWAKTPCLTSVPQGLSDVADFISTYSAQQILQAETVSGGVRGGDEPESDTLGFQDLDGYIESVIQFDINDFTAKFFWKSFLENGRVLMILC